MTMMATNASNNRDEKLCMPTGLLILMAVKFIFHLSLYSFYRIQNILFTPVYMVGPGLYR
jgi:hypothetical protein